MEGSCAVRTDELSWLFARSVVGQMEARFSLAKCNIQVLGFYRSGGKLTSSVAVGNAGDLNHMEGEKRKTERQVLSHAALRHRGRKHFEMTVQERDLL